MGLPIGFFVAAYRENVFSLLFLQLLGLEEFKSDQRITAAVYFSIYATFPGKSSHFP